MNDHTIRLASGDDIPHMISLAAQRRADYSQHHSLFWRIAGDASQKQHAFFERLLMREDVIMLVYEQNAAIRGFVIGTLLSAPPVYDPGGPTCLVDDFAVEDATMWQSVGRTLLLGMQQVAKQRGAVQLVVVCGHHDDALRALLTAMDCSIASEWWVGTL